MNFTSDLKQWKSFEDKIPYAKEISLLYLYTFCMAILTGYMANFIVFDLEIYHFKPAYIGDTNSATSLGAIFFTPFCHHLFKFFNFKNILKLGTLSAFLIVLLTPYIISDESFFVLRLFAGLAKVLIYTSVSISIQHFAAGSPYKTTLFTVNGIALFLGSAVGYTLSGLMGMSTTTFHIVGFLICCLSFLPLYWFPNLNLFKTFPPKTKQKEESLFKLIRLIPLIGIGGFLIIFITKPLGSFLVLYGKSITLTREEAAFLLTCVSFGSILLTPLLTWISDHYKLQKSALLIFALLTVGISSILFFIPLNLSVLHCFLFLIGGITSALYSMIITSIGTHFEGPNLSAALSGYKTVCAISGFLLPIFLGLLTTHYNLSAIFLVISVSSALLFIINILPTRGSYEK